MHQKVAFEEPIVVPENGHTYIWLSNESENTHVWFDDLKISREGADVVQATDYGAWGDVIREQKTEPTDIYRWYYQGQYAERDLETGWSHFELRQYDPIVGRWTSMDPYGQYWSPYNGMGNDPVNGVDPDGGLFGKLRAQIVAAFTKNGYVWEDVDGNWHASGTKMVKFCTKF